MTPPPEPPLAGSPPPTQVHDLAPPPKGFRLQVTDDIAEPFQPAIPPTQEDATRRQARTWYMAGEVHSPTAARSPKRIECYRKSITLDPTAILVYGPLIGHLHDEGETDEAKKYAFEAAERDHSACGSARILAGAQPPPAGSRHRARPRN